jgi:hypothetical protein
MMAAPDVTTAEARIAELETRVNLLVEQMQSLAHYVGEIIVDGLGFDPPAAARGLLEWHVDLDEEDPNPEPVGWWSLTDYARQTIAASAA